MEEEEDAIIFRDVKMRIDVAVENKVADKAIGARVNISANRFLH